MSGVILLGGGLDSTALLLHLVKEKKQTVTGFFVLYGQLADKLELKAINYWCDKLEVPVKVFNLPLGTIADSAILRNGKPGTNKLEGRNVILTMAAATYAATIGAEELYLGYHKEPENAPFPDATEEAAKAMQTVLDVAYKHRIRLLAPFKHLSRTEIFRMGFALDEGIIDHTHTCYNAVEGGCGNCVHCRQRMTMINNLLSEEDEPLEENH